MALTVTKVKGAKPKAKDYKLADEKGLFLLVKKNGAKYWRMKYRVAGREKLLALGVFPDTTLAMAQKKRDEARQQLAAGIDPMANRKAMQQAAKDATVNSFETVAREWLAKRGKKSASNDDRLVRLLEKDLFPVIGKLPIREITAPVLLKALRKIESRGAVETAHRTKQYAGQIFRYAIATDRAERDPSVDLKGALATPSQTHFAAITTPKEAGKLMASIDTYQGTPVVKAALQLSALFFCRQGELRHLEWTDVNWEEHRIEIPGERMKMGEPHIIPICRQALAILEDLHALTGRHRYLFPSARGASRPLSENGVRTALRTMGYDNATMTPHGFRAMARTLLDEVQGCRVDWIEQQLAHQVRDATGRAYNRTKFLEQRREMMQRWADYLDELKLHAITGNVVSANFGRGGAV